MTLSLVNYDRNDCEIRDGTKDPGVSLFFPSKDPSTIIRRHRYTLESLLLRHSSGVLPGDLCQGVMVYEGKLSMFRVDGLDAEGSLQFRV